MKHLKRLSIGFTFLGMLALLVALAVALGHLIEHYPSVGFGIAVLIALYCIGYALDI